MPILSYQDAKNILPTIENSVFVSGCFDILHIGHIRFLQEASKYGDNLIILLEGDEFIRRAKNRESFHTQSERAEILSMLRFVHSVVLLPHLISEVDYQRMFTELAPRIVVVSNHDPYVKKKREQIGQAGGKVTEINTLVANKSTTKILEYFG